MKNKPGIMFCPRCSSRNLGKIKAKHYYCRECFLELEFEKKGIKAYEIDVDGSLKEIEHTA